MLKIFGKKYYIDFEKLDDFLLIDKDPKKRVEDVKSVVELFNETGQLVTREVRTDENIKHKEINGVRFEITRNFIEDLALGSENGSDDYDEMLGTKALEKMPTRFKLAFNTLLFYNILRKIDLD
jgi:hypothetical protein